MLKKILLSLTFTVALVFANAQCTPDPQFTAAGIYPDSATGLSPAYVGQSYSEVITVITPLDTSTLYNGTLIDVTVSTITLASLTGLPSNFTYTCDAPNCSFPGGTTSCAVLTSTSNPTMADVGSYQLIMTTETDGMGTVGPVTIPLPTQTDVIDNYYLDIQPDNLFEIKKPVGINAIGVDRLPEHIHQTNILSKNDLARLGNIEKIPENKEIIEFLASSETEKIIGLVDESEKVKLVHKKVKDLLESDEIEKAILTLFSI